MVWVWITMILMALVIALTHARIATLERHISSLREGFETLDAIMDVEIRRLEELLSAYEPSPEEKF